MFRVGLLLAMLLLFVGFVAALISRLGPAIIADALVYVVAVRLFVDGAFGAALNLGIISRRQFIP